MATLTQNEVTNGHAVTLMAREVTNTVLDFGSYAGQGTDAAVLTIVARSEKTEVENMKVVNDVTNTVLMGVRDGLQRGEIEDRVLLELLWVGYWAPNL